MGKHLHDKANKKDVEDEMSRKADQTDLVRIFQSLDLKADQMKVDQILRAIENKADKFEL